TFSRKFSSLFYRFSFLFLASFCIIFSFFVIVKMEKRHKTKNFTTKERNVLLALIKSKKPLITSKISSAVMIKRKAEAWEDVKNNFNRMAETARSVKQLKTLYENMKRKVRKEQNKRIREKIIKMEADISDDEVKTEIFDVEIESTMEKSEGYATEGIKQECDEITGTNQEILANLVDEMTPDTNLCDSSSQYHNVNSSRPEPEPVLELEPTSVPNRTRRKNNYHVTSEEIKRRYFFQKLKNAQFEARAQRLIFHLDLKIKKKQLEMLNRD
ncbi:unnamed protein product, partial [Phyllotreta striolata]